MKPGGLMQHLRRRSSTRYPKPYQIPISLRSILKYNILPNRERSDIAKFSKILQNLARYFYFAEIMIYSAKDKRTAI